MSMAAATNLGWRFDITILFLNAPNGELIIDTT
jgi:hypothetical protein